MNNVNKAKHLLFFFHLLIPSRDVCRLFPEYNYHGKPLVKFIALHLFISMTLAMVSFNDNAPWLGPMILIVIYIFNIVCRRCVTRWSSER